MTLSNFPEAVVTEQPHSSAKELICHLLGLTTWTPLLSRSEQTIYRGHGAQDYRLVPCAFRGVAEFKDFVPPSVQRIGRHLGFLADYELSALCRFVMECDRAGIALPGDSPSVRDTLRIAETMGDTHAISTVLVQEKFEALLGVMATARHAEVPTRLLDWTSSPLIAMYFAAKDNIDQRNSGNDNYDFESMAIWEFKFENYREASSLYLREGDVLLRHFVPPAALIPRLRAQHGSFTYSLVQPGDHDPAENGTVDELILRAVRDSNSSVSALFTPLLTKHTLPSIQAARLLQYLASMNVMASTVFPDFAGAVEAIRERGLWAAPHNELVIGVS